MAILFPPCPNTYGPRPSPALPLSPSPPSPFQIFHGHRSLNESQQLFKRARAFISPHGALLTNLLFMPPGSAVLEIRPRLFDNNVYHYLAFIAELPYFMVYAEGAKNTDLKVDLGELQGVMEMVLARVGVP